jgi:hypothetical protein
MKRLKICRGLALAVAIAVSLFAQTRVFAQTITAVEEDWLLEVDAPNPAASSPQVNCLISPAAGPQGVHAVFLLNERTAGTSVGGGLQLQLWNGPTLLGVGSFPASTASLGTSGERITWTTRMSVANGVLTIQVQSGKSNTWGNFGGGSQLLVSTPTSLVNLNSYDPNLTTANSGVDFGNRRVDKLVLRKIRLYSGNKKLVEQADERVVYQN